MSSFEEIYDDVIQLAENGGVFVGSGELRLEKHLAEALDRQEWLSLFDEDSVAPEATEAYQNDLFNRERISKLEIARLMDLWQMPEWPLRRTLSGLYGNLSFFYRRNLEAEEFFAQGGMDFGTGFGTLEERCTMWKAGAERCAEKALDATGLSAQDTMYLPASFEPDFFFLLHWNLASAKYLLGKKEECLLYLQCCLKIRPTDPELIDIRRDAAVSMYEEVAGSTIQ
ncbi:MAG: hypothetical protein U0X20_26065 [Caldilineaceae bacterium]